MIDLWPTILELAGVKPAAAHGKRQGISLVPAFTGAKPEPRTIWWSHDGNRALRDADWKISFAARSGEWELYDLSSDRAETENLARENPAKLESLKRRWSELNQRHSEMAKTN